MRPLTAALFAAAIAYPAAALAQGNLPVEREDLPENTNEGTPAENTGGQPAYGTAVLKGIDGKEHGTVRFETAQTGVVIRASFTGLPPGTHGIHIHEKGACEPDFEAAGGHFNPTGAAHGILDEDGPHVGDLPNIHVPENGELTIEFFAPLLTLSAGTEQALLDQDGAAVVIHSGADDYKTDPSGNSGDRIACGVIEAARPE